MNEDLNELIGTLASQDTLYLMDNKIVKPFAIPGSDLFERYRTKIVQNQSGNDILRVDYDASTSPDSAKGLFAKIQEKAAGLLNFKVGDLNGNYLNTIKVDSFMTTTHKFQIMNGDGTQVEYQAVHRMMNLAKVSLVVTKTDGTEVLSCEYRGFRKLIEVKDSSGQLVTNLHAPIFSPRSRWQLDFTGECDRILVLIMVAIISELGDR